DRVWKALADSTRRDILDVLAERPQTTGEVVGRFPHLCRTAVMKHMDVLVEAELVIIRREGRQRWNYLNPAPIQAVCDRWVSRHVRHLASAMGRLREVVEEQQRIQSHPIAAPATRAGGTEP
ncbi:MAG: winged helix-turn-helix transcriptional regulator, partial [Phycisphaerales bacterium]|nr:winged helix-turn-helix transcriptional regulator [Phycisphaerales bacterium]